MLTLKECQELIHVYLKKISLPESPSNLYEPIRYMLEPEGKRIRPVLVLLGCNVFSDDITQAVPAAMAIEVFHNFTLMHDDIMDKALMRRNRHAVHVKWSSNIALLSGDAMVIKAYELLAELDVPSFPRVFSLFNETALKVCEGQQYDMDFECRTDISAEDYLHMVELKTAVLLAASLKSVPLQAALMMLQRIFFMNSAEISELPFSCRMTILMYMPIRRPLEKRWAMTLYPIKRPCF